MKHSAIQFKYIFLPFAFGVFLVQLIVAAVIQGTFWFCETLPLNEAVFRVFLPLLLSILVPILLRRRLKLLRDDIRNSFSVVTMLVYLGASVITGHVLVNSHSGLHEEFDMAKIGTETRGDYFSISECSVDENEILMRSGIVPYNSRRLGGSDLRAFCSAVAPVNFHPISRDTTPSLWIAISASEVISNRPIDQDVELKARQALDSCISLAKDFDFCNGSLFKHLQLSGTRNSFISTVQEKWIVSNPDELIILLPIRAVPDNQGLSNLKYLLLYLAFFLPLGWFVIWVHDVDEREAKKLIST